MEDNYIVKTVDNTRWKQAQEFELKFAQCTIDSNDDWNRWWYEKFFYYSILTNQIFDNVLEVGCGPHTNIKFMLPLIKTKKIWLEDPLIQYYITYNLTKLNSHFFYLKNKLRITKTNYLLKLFSDLNIKVDLSLSKLEDLPYRNNQMDLIVCINTRPCQ